MQNAIITDHSVQAKNQLQGAFNNKDMSVFCE